MSNGFVHVIQCGVSDLIAQFFFLKRASRYSSILKSNLYLLCLDQNIGAAIFKLELRTFGRI